MAYGNSSIDAEIAKIDAAMHGPTPPPITLTGAARQQIGKAIKASIEAHQRVAKQTKVRYEQRLHAELAAGLERAQRMLDQPTPADPAANQTVPAPPAIAGQIDAIADRAIVRIAADFADKTSSLAWRDGVIDLADAEHRQMLHRSIADALADVKRASTTERAS